MLKIEQHILLKGFETNTWLIYDEQALDAILIDPSAPSEELANRMKRLNLQLKLIINTHGHGDHIGGNSFFKERFNAPVAIHSLDAIMLTDNKRNLSAYMDMPLDELKADQLLEDGYELSLGETIIKIIHTPGHTRGGICLYYEKHLISGDTLFEQSIGRTDLPGGNYEAIISSIRHKLFTLPEDTIVYPGHGPKTLIGLEKTNNPFVK